MALMTPNAYILERIFVHSYICMSDLPQPLEKELLNADIGHDTEARLCLEANYDETLFHTCLPTTKLSIVKRKSGYTVMPKQKIGVADVVCKIQREIVRKSLLSAYFYPEDPPGFLNEIRWLIRVQDEAIELFPLNSSDFRPVHQCRKCTIHIRTYYSPLHLVVVCHGIPGKASRFNQYVAPQSAIYAQTIKVKKPPKAYMIHKNQQYFKQKITLFVGEQGAFNSINFDALLKGGKWDKPCQQLQSNEKIWGVATYTLFFDPGCFNC